RQEPCGPYILDFYCAVAGLVIELDGDTHLGREISDRERDEYLKGCGLLVLRIANGQVYDEPDAVLELIARTCAERTGANQKVSQKVDDIGRFQPRPES